MSTLPAARAQIDPVPPTAPYLKTYTSNYNSTEFSWQLTDYGDGVTNYSVFTRVTTGVLGWNKFIGGTNTFQVILDEHGATTDYADYDAHTDYSWVTLWATPDVGGSRTITDIFVNLSDPSQSYTNSYPDVDQPAPNPVWEYANVPTTKSDAGSSIWTGYPPSTIYYSNSVQGSLSIVTTVEMNTGGVPGSTDPCLVTVSASAYDKLGGTNIDPTRIVIKGQNLGSDGTMTFASTCNTTETLTVAVTDLDTNNFDFTFSVGLAGPPFAINMTMAGSTNNIANTNVTVIVGQPINLSVSSLPPGASNIVYTWSMPPSTAIFADFLTNATNGGAVPFTNIHASTILFYFNDAGGSPYRVSCNVSGALNGTNISLTTATAFNVITPMATYNLITNDVVRVSTSYVKKPGTNALHFGGFISGNSTTKGITFKVSDVNTFGYQDEWSFVHILTNSIIQYVQDDGRAYEMTTLGLDDGAYPYDMGTFVSGPPPYLYTSDSPGTTFSSLQRAKYRRIEWFEMYLMFRPSGIAGSKPVAIKKGAWKWSGSITNTATGFGFDNTWVYPNAASVIYDNMNWTKHPNWSQPATNSTPREINAW